MAEYVSCPSCGCKLLVADGMVGRPMRCFACERTFVAQPPSPAAVPPTPAAVPARPQPSQPRGLRPFGLPREPGRQPLCPGCGRAVEWEFRTCPYCGEEFVDEPAERTGAERLVASRRDAMPHRGRVLVNLGNVSLALGLLAFCTAGLSGVISVPLGAVIWVLANADLQAMKAGELDSRGWPETEAARTAAASGVVLGVVFLIGWGLLWLRL
jgi:hypothetical protein